MDNLDELILALAAQIVSAYVVHNPVSAEALPQLVLAVAQALRAAHQRSLEPERPRPAVPLQHSIAQDFVACLECGKRFRTLKRHLEREHAMSEEEYRARWQLPATYKLTAPEYTELRAAVARKIGLGRAPRGRSGR